MILHRPYGIDDPYKRLPSERYPRDPEAGDAVQVGFRADPDAAEAWLTLHGPHGVRRYDATALGAGAWTVLLPELAVGAWSYTIHTRSGTGDEVSESYALPVGRWRSVDRVCSIDIEAAATTVVVGDEHGPRARLRMSFPLPGVCSTAFLVPGRAAEALERAAGSVAERADTAADDVGVSSRVRPHPSSTDRTSLGADEALEHSVERRDGFVVLCAQGIEVRIDESTLELRVYRPGASPDVPLVRTSAALAWLEQPDGRVTRFRSRFELHDREELYGLGERFAEPGLRGRTWDARVYEEYKEQGTRTYVPVPFVISSEAWGVWIDTDAPSHLDARGSEAVFTVDVPDRPGPELRQQLIVGTAPYDVTQAFTRLTGEIALPPKWAYGPWMSANTWNSQEKAEREVARTLEEGVPATVLVLEAWSDESTFYVFNDAQYEPVAGSDALRLADFRFGGRWPDPKKMIDACHENGVRVLLWQIPVQKRLDEHHPQHAADEAHMLEQGFAIRNGDGSAYRNKGWWFTDALVLDVTNPAARDWWFAKRQYLFDELGIDGMKTDGGEHLWGRDLLAHNGQTGTELVNRYAQAYVDAYHDFVRERTGGDGLTFSRAGYTGAQRSPAHWAGDENSTWSAFRASIQAGLSAGLAGISIWGWDIGGFSGEIPSVELYVRSAQMAAFCPIMQYHSELHQSSDCRDRTPWNIAERHADSRALTIYRAYARLRMRLLDYIADEAAALAAEGQPLMRYPGLVWREARDDLMRDPSAYLFGRDLLVAPVLEKGAQTRAVTLPPGEWTDFWSGARFAGGRTVLLPAPLERIPVLVRADSPRLEDLLEAARGFEVS